MLNTKSSQVKYR